MPPLDLTDENVRARAASVARAVLPFYYDEYVHQMDAAARGSFSFFGQAVDFGSPEGIDWHHQVGAESDFHLWRMKLGHMGFMCPMLVSGEDHHLDAVLEMMHAYRGASDFGVPGCFSSYWFPYSVSHRVLAILSGYVLALEREALSAELREELESFIRWNSGFILLNVEHELRNNHVERNLAALCFYLSCTSAPSARLSRRLDREVRRVMRACVLPDGFIAERSAMYQGLAVMATDVFARATCLSEETRALASSLHRIALQAWLTMSHPDGEIALFNDSWFGEVPRPCELEHANHVEPVGLLAAAGYARLQSDELFVLFDAGEIGPRWNPGHGHADFLSVELDVLGERFLVDPGTYQYSTGSRRVFERSSRSHNGPVTGIEPVQYFGCFRVGRLRAATVTAFEEKSYGGSVSGRLALPDGNSVSRRVDVSAATARFVDEWTRDSLGAAVRLTVPAEWVLQRRGTQDLIFTRGSVTAGIRVSSGSIVSIDAGQWACNYLESREATVICLEPIRGSSLGTRLDWAVYAHDHVAGEGYDALREAVDEQ